MFRWKRKKRSYGRTHARIIIHGNFPAESFIKTLLSSGNVSIRTIRRVDEVKLNCDLVALKRSIYEWLNVPPRKENFMRTGK